MGIEFEGRSYVLCEIGRRKPILHRLPVFGGEFKKTSFPELACSRDGIISTSAAILVM